jgi:hypothetical protein
MFEKISTEQRTAAIWLVYAIISIFVGDAETQTWGCIVIANVWVVADRLMRRLNRDSE